MKHKILIVSGDPNSINSEIIYKTFKNLNNDIKKRFLSWRKSKHCKIYKRTNMGSSQR